MSLTLCSFATLGTVALALNRLGDVTSPTEVGTTTIPSGNYVVMDQSTGKSYPLSVTTNGTMIIGPAGTSPQSLTGLPTSKQSLTKTLEQEVRQGANDLMRREGTNQLQNLIK
ncbi:MAG: hypothetical protein C5B53_00815 [Candidatus Melainabacteria bacterium]|nr:MAG: hypothetical protein C5B53_00815 [Candidatus Melainabacteria bacterium]